jgi:uncharacterized protein (TIGR03435 family)
VIARFLVLFVTFAVSGFAGQSGMYGPVSNHPKAGEIAPGIKFTKIVSAPNGASWLPTSLAGHVTVVGFYPDTSHNSKAETRWNALVDRFARMSVQFVWVTGEKESTLGPWLEENPLKGFVMLDPEGSTGRSYGIELPAAVIVGADGRIIGFDSEPVPSADTLNAALEGRITNTPTKPAAAGFNSFIDKQKVFLAARAPGRPGDEHRPDFPPSYDLHISPSQIAGTGDYGSDDFKSLQGFDVKSALSRLYDVGRVRIELPKTVDDGERYDFSMVLPKAESSDQVNQRLEQGILDHFNLTASRDTRMADVYVVTPVDDKPTMLKPQADEDGGISSINISFERPATPGDGGEAAASPKSISMSAITGLSAEGTMDEICKELENFLDRPVVNETNLKGRFTLNLKASESGKNDFLARLRDQFGLDVEPAQRNIEILAFRPR